MHFYILEYTAFIKHCRGAYPKKRLGDEDTWVMHSNNKTLVQLKYIYLYINTCLNF